LVIICDTREQNPWTFDGYPSIKIVRRKLITGDYSLEGHTHRVAIERKSKADLHSTLSKRRGNFKAELERLSSLYRRAVIVECGDEGFLTGPQYYRSVRLSKTRLAAAQWATCAGWAAIHDVPFYFKDTRSLAERWAYYLLRKWATLLK